MTGAAPPTSVRPMPPQPWMTAPATQRVIGALTADGAEVRFVGGCVRDGLLGRAVRDIDIATHDPPETVMRLLARAGLKVVPTGIAHGTVTAIADGKPFEITTLRLDVETHGRHARIEFTDDWQADAARRDFTINALSLTPEGTLHDPFGGVADLEAGRVRFVGDPRQRIGEDVLRLLRFFRFHAHYGRQPVDAAGLEACRELVPSLAILSAERVRAELLRLLVAPSAAAILALMRDARILDRILPEARRLDRLAALITVMPDADPVLRLAALTDLDAGAARAMALRLRLANKERDRLLAVVGPAELGDDGPGHRRALHRLGVEAYRDRAALAWAEALAAAAPSDPCPHRERLVTADAWRVPALPVDGADVLALGVAPGTAVGRLLKEVEDWWAEGGFTADRAACLANLASRVRSPRSGPPHGGR
ncbi:MAG: CCA tRNA nucleotidyltransferase [Alphaproteobacteria bacterium]|nr:CCA tRNA nucleotidyltransferase [Alphaproteobacteria bacterium]